MARAFAKQPFSSQDIDPAQYEAMIRQHAADVSARRALDAPDPEPQDFSSPTIGGPMPTAQDWANLGHAFSDWQKSEPIGHPGFAEGLVPVWGSGREALADLQEGDYWGAAGNGALAVSDVIPAKAVGTALAKTAGKAGWELGIKTAPTGWRAVRNDLTGIMDLEKGQIVHHWLLPQKLWGKGKFDWVKNQLWNLKPMPSREIHNAIHGQFGQAKLNALARYYFGTPAWWKAANLSLFGRGVDEARDPKRPLVANPIQ